MSPFSDISIQTLGVLLDFVSTFALHFERIPWDVLSFLLSSYIASIYPTFLSVLSVSVHISVGLSPPCISMVVQNEQPLQHKEILWETGNKAVNNKPKTTTEHMKKEKGGTRRGREGRVRTAMCSLWRLGNTGSRWRCSMWRRAKRREKSQARHQWIFYIFLVLHPLCIFFLLRQLCEYIIGHVIRLFMRFRSSSYLFEPFFASVCWRVAGCVYIF